LSPAVTADLTGLFHRPFTARHILHSSETTWVSPCSMCLVAFVAFMRGINNWRISILLADLIGKLNLCPVLVEWYHFAHANAWVWPILLSHDCKAKLWWIQLYYAPCGRTTLKPHWFPSLKLVLSSLMCENMRNMFKLNQSLTWQKAKNRSAGGLKRAVFSLFRVFLPRENSQTFWHAPTVCARNGVWGTSAEIPYWWCVTNLIWLVLLIGWS